MRFFIYETDSRQKMISKFLIEKGFTKVVKADISKADIVILPFINVEKQITINNEFLSSLKYGVKVFTGGKNEVLRNKFEKFQIELVEIMSYKHMTILNAVPTAEGVIYNILKDFDNCILGSNVLVMGYGICGREIVKKLKALGSNIDILDRTERKYSMALTIGVGGIVEKDLKNKNYDIIINTIPSKILNNETIDFINKDTLIYDISSAPYGFDEKYMNEIGLSYKILGGLPSKFGLKFTGKNVSDFIYKKVEGE